MKRLEEQVPMQVGLEPRMMQQGQGQEPRNWQELNGQVPIHPMYGQQEPSCERRWQQG
jgi:hypothetical protein